ncbi:MAG: sigma-54-dependent Fis family transcriptional regulator [Ignavibacteria bacterium]|jgi:DNA-binding NtrC family response regulator|nr:sigma-54-dependent Fis family transcriptional regulator [Ignavibacteria bacterium]
MEIKILLIDDEPKTTGLYGKVLSEKGYAVTQMSDSREAVKLIENNFFDIIISDLQMPGYSGIDVLKKKPEESIFILVTGYASIESAVEAMQLGAYDYLMKPLKLEELILKVENAAEKINLKRDINQLRSQVEQNFSFGNIIGKSKKMQEVYDLIKRVSGVDVNVHIEGESGTGKELVSKAIHFNSMRKNNAFIAINCAAIPETLLESELFGHTKGAFTGATEMQKGVFETANGGTLFLDEISEMPYNLQSKLLRVLENWEIKPVGSDRIKKIDVKLISASNQNLKELVNQKKFREDLYYRIATFNIVIPPLRERIEDIPLLTDYFLERLSKKFDREITITPAALKILMQLEWQGNVRELENTLERAIITSNDSVLKENSFKFYLQSSPNKSNLNGFASQSISLKDMEKEYIKKTLEDCKWNKVKASRVLGIDRKTLYNKLAEYKLEK